MINSLFRHILNAEFTSLSRQYSTANSLAIVFALTDMNNCQQLLGHHHALLVYGAHYYIMDSVALPRQF
jgi:hypothetical protein